MMVVEEEEEDKKKLFNLIKLKVEISLNLSKSFDVIFLTNFHILNFFLENTLMTLIYFYVDTCQKIL